VYLFLCLLSSVLFTECASTPCCPAAVCGTVLPGPAAAARAAAAASNKQRSAAEAAIAASVSDALHLLGALRSLLPLVSGEGAERGQLQVGDGRYCSICWPLQQGWYCMALRVVATVVG
jgi:hypothetical protein